MAARAAGREHELRRTRAMKIPSHAFPLLAIALGATLLGSTSAPCAFGQTSTGPDGTLPSSETVRSLLMNNWTDSLAVHYARQLSPADPHLFGPYLAGLHSAIDWPVNQIDGATAFIRTEIIDADGASPGSERPPALCESSGEAKGDDAPADPGLRYSYPSVMCFDDGGVLNVEYVREAERALPIQIEKAYAMAPNRRFLVVRYTLINNVPAEQNKSVRVRFAEVTDLNNKAALDHEESQEDLVETGINEPKPGQPIQFMRAQWHPELNAWIANMQASNGTFLVFGAFQDMDRHRVFAPASDEIEFDRAIASEMDAFDQADLAANVDEQTARDLALALWNQGEIEPAGRRQYSFFYAVASSLEDAQQLARQAREPPTAPEVWFNETRSAYQNWLQQGRQFETQDPALRKALDRGLVTIKQSQQPAFGSIVAATNPAYGFKVWPRDSSITALGLAASGHLDEAVKLYRWMASVQENGSQEQYPAGTWYSNYGYWARKRPKTFVEPEWDSLGLFAIGVYHTWRLLNERDPQAALKFLTDPLEGVAESPGSVYEAVRRSADYISNSVNEHQFGPGDHSIWEEQFQWNTFTQVTYASGLNAARFLAEAVGETDRANTWLDSGNRILTVIYRPASAQPCAGLFNDGEQRWNRATSIDCTRDDRIDASSDLAWVFGLVHATDERAASQRDAVLSRLTPGEDDIGIARYEGDEFYHDSEFSPGGPREATEQMSSWPQMDMYVGMLEHWRGLDATALQRLQWYASVTNVGYMPPGEAVDWPTNRPLPSTAAEPVTGAWYALGLLNYLNLFDPRLPPLEPKP
jgi:GH15 family glucan-1,4-alpha-glucosidase